MNIHVAHIQEHKLTGRRLGRHIEHDPRSREFAHVELLDQSALKSQKWDRHCPPFDQGELGSCTGNATTGACMTDPFFVTGRTLTETDAVSLYELATTLDSIPGAYPPDDTGSSGLAACKAAKNKGWIGSYTHALTLAAALTALQHGPAITGINWYTSFDSPAADGTVAIAKGAVVRGGHEICVDELVLVFAADGKTIDMTNSKIGLTNSWGTSWGVKGRFNMTLSTWARLLNEGGDVTVPHPAPAKNVESPTESDEESDDETEKEAEPVVKPKKPTVAAT